VIKCYLSDKNGNELNPYEPGAVKYTASQLYRINNCDKKEAEYLYTVLIEGYLTICINNCKLSNPIYFRIEKLLLLSCPKTAELFFAVKKFRLGYTPVSCNNVNTAHILNINIDIITEVCSKGKTDLIVPVLDSDSSQCNYNKICVLADRIYCSNSFNCKIIIKYEFNVLKANIYQYNAISQNTKRIYTNEDELKKYGDQGILSPESVSYSSVFINGVLQPNENYILREGFLELLTQELPQTGEPISILFVTIISENTVLKAVSNKYVIISDGDKRHFTNSDIVSATDNNGIPDPNDISFNNLFVNGIIQPQANYIIQKGTLILKTCDIPLKNATVILEALTMTDKNDRIITAEISMYNAFSNEGKVYTNCEELKKYGADGIISPNCCSYFNLFVNGAIQPEVNYSVQKGWLILNTHDTPLKSCMVSLQFITVIQ
jgi:hypothetical protein